MKSTINYLKDNNINITNGLLFTCNDYSFLIDNNETEIIINKDRENREEMLNKQDILQRIQDLLFLYELEDNRRQVEVEKVYAILKKEKIKE